MKNLEIKYLSDDWYDMNYVLFHACFQTLVNYIENEDPFMDEKIMDEMLQRLIEIKGYMWT